jgi:hypothetical protein
MNRIEDNDQVFEPDCAQIQEEEAHYYHTLMDFLDADVHKASIVRLVN